MDRRALRIQMVLVLAAASGVAGCGASPGAKSRSTDGQPYVHARQTPTGPVCGAASGGLTTSRYQTTPPASPRAGQSSASGPLTTWSREMEDPALAVPAPGTTVVATNEGQGSPAAVLVTLDGHGHTVVSHAWDAIAGGPIALPGGQVALLTSTICTAGLTPVPNVPFIYRVVLRVGSPTTVLGQSGVVLSERAIEAAMVGDARGDVAVLWGEDVRGRTADFLAVRSASGRLGRKQALPYIGDPQFYLSTDDYSIALGPRGDLLLTYTVAARHGPGQEVIARYQPAGGQLGPPTTIGRSRRQAEVVAAVDDRGGAVIAWGSRSYGPDYANPWIVRAAVRARAGAPFGPASVLDSGAGNHGPAADGEDLAAGPAIGEVGVPGSIQAAMAGREPIVAWSTAEAGDHTPTRIALADTAGSFSRPTILAANAQLTEPPLNDNGAVLLGIGGAVVRIRPGEPMASTQATVPGDHETNVATAVDPYTGRLVLTWTRHTGTDDQAPDQLRIATVGLADAP